MSTAIVHYGPHSGLLDWLASESVEYELHEHPLTFTARQTAYAEGVDPRTFAKVIGVADEDGHQALLVLTADDHLDMRKARRLMDADDVRLLSEEELGLLAPECEVGAIPAVGQVFGVPLFADYAVRDDPQISFNAGSHSYAVRVERLDWERATGVTYADLAEDHDRRPAWARS